MHAISTWGKIFSLRIFKIMMGVGNEPVFRTLKKNHIIPNPLPQNFRKIWCLTTWADRAFLKPLFIMVLILDGNLEIGAHWRSNIYYLICLRQLIRLRAVSAKTFFLSWVLNMFSELPFNISTMKTLQICNINLFISCQPSFSAFLSLVLIFAVKTVKVPPLLQYALT